MDRRIKVRVGIAVASGLRAARLNEKQVADFLKAFREHMNMPDKAERTSK